ncbi:MAG TPA: NUDIX domain-containing protein [Saprospiraceae bacterium]|nr:NUDIX domain-containing protein [Saprospiraceae bacterium]HND87781.1 NUDIX domain-containing protein [Saprospiraceae bacterium]
MNTEHILDLLAAHTSRFDEERLFLKWTAQFVQQHPDEWWQRRLLVGHLTGSAWVLHPDGEQALLVHHINLDKWVQPGGHADTEDVVLLQTARREAQEESGIIRLRALSEEIFDLDVHVIPAKRDVPEHLHYDVRFLFQAEEAALQADPAEVKGARWVPIREMRVSPSLQQSVRRMAMKI